MRSTLNKVHICYPPAPLLNFSLNLQPPSAVSSALGSVPSRVVRRQPSPVQVARSKSCSNTSTRRSSASDAIPHNSLSSRPSANRDRPCPFDFSLFSLLPFRLTEQSRQSRAGEMLLGIGVDLLSLTRLRAVVARRGADKLASRILSTEERLEWDQRREDAAWTGEKQEQYLAAR